MKKNILIFAGFYLPGVKGGGPIKSISNLVDHLSSDYNFYIVADDRDLGDEKPYEGIAIDDWNKTDNCFIFYTNKENLNIKKIKQIIDSIDIDILYLNSLFDLKLSIIPILMQKFGIIDIKKIIIAPRGNLSPGALQQKEGKKKLLIMFSKLLNTYENVVWHATAEMEKQDIINTFGEKSKIIVANNLTMNYQNMSYDKEIRKESGKIKIIFLSRIHPKKNLLFCLKLLNKIKEDVIFDIYGPIEDKNYWEKCKDIITSLPNNITVNYEGIVVSKDIIKTFSEYHIFLFPTLGENFGHVITESLISGCPVITSDQTPWNNLENEKVGFSIKLNDVVKYTKAIQKYIEMDEKEYSKISRLSFEFAQKNSNDSNTINSYYKLFG